MKVQETFVIAEPRERLWEFFEQVDQVARCVPGVESVEVIDDENSKVRVTQSIGPMTATFDLKMKITERSPQELMQFTAIGRAVKGAAGNIRTTNTVRLSDTEDGTRVELESELAMGGVLGSVGQKVVARQAGQVTKQFSDALERAIKGEPEPVPAAAAQSQRSAPAAAQPSAAPAATADDTAQRVGVLVASLLALFVAWRLLTRARER